MRLYTLILLFTTLNLYAQNNKLKGDELKSKAFIYEDINIDSSIYFHEAAIKQYRIEKNDYKLCEELLNYIALCQSKKENWQKTKKIFVETNKLAKELKNDTLYVFSKLLEADNYISANKEFQALIIYKDILNLAESINSYWLPVLYSNMATIFDKIDKTDFALTIINKGLKRAKDNSDWSGYFQLAEKEIDFNYHIKKYNYAILLGEAYFYQCNKRNNILELPYIAKSLVKNYLAIGDTLNARNIINTTNLKLNNYKTKPAETLKYNDSRMIFSFSEALYYIKIKKFDEAIKILKNIETNLDQSYILITTDIYQELYKAYLGKRDFETALNYELKIDSINKEVNKKEVLVEIFENKFDIEARLKEAENNLLVSENSKFKFYSEISIVIIILFIIATTFIYFYNKTRKQKDKLEIELKASKIKTNSEILIYQKLADEKKKIYKQLHDEVSNGLLSLNLMLSSFENNMEPFHTTKLKKLIEIITDIEGTTRSYLRKLNNEVKIINEINDIKTIVNDLLQNKAKLIFNVDEAVYDHYFSVEAILNIKLIIQELVLNIIKHADATEVKININEITKNEIRLCVLDNGKGIKDDRKNGIGLNSIKERVNELEGILDIKKLNKGTEISIQFKNQNINATK